MEGGKDKRNLGVRAFLDQIGCDSGLPNKTRGPGKFEFQINNDENFYINIFPKSHGI